MLRAAPAEKAISLSDLKSRDRAQAYAHSRPERDRDSRGPVSAPSAPDAASLLRKTIQDAMTGAGRAHEEQDKKEKKKEERHPGEKKIMRPGDAVTF